jgi:4-amino-4-deoxy-L-arabinose transferase-like glycosyltransferase
MLKTYRKDTLIVFVLLALIFAYFYQDSGWNGNSRFSLIFSIVQDKSLSIDNFFDKEGTKTGDHSEYKGHYYSDKAIGPAVIGALLDYPISWIQKATHHPSEKSVEGILTFLVIGIPSAVAGSLMYLLCVYLSKRRAWSFIITMAVTLGTLSFPFSVTFFSHQFTASLLFCAFFMMFFLKEGEQTRKNGYLFLIGLLLGFAVISVYTCAAIVLPLVIYYLVVIWKRPDYRRLRSILLPFLGGLLPVALQLVYNKLCFGSIFSIGYSNLDNQYFSSAMGQGVMGINWPSLQVLFYMTFHPTMGLFWQSPVLILSFAGAYFALRQYHYRQEVILAIWIIVSYLVLLSGYFMWWGGYSLGPRHIIPILPFFCLLLVFLPHKFRWPLTGLSLISIAQMLIPAASTVLVPDTMISNLGSMSFFQYSNIYNYCLPELIKGNFTANLGQRFFHLHSWHSLIPLLVAVIVLIVLFFWNEIRTLGKPSLQKQVQ